MSSERADSVGIDAALPVYMKLVKEGKTMKQIADVLKMNAPSLSTKISTARTQIMVATRVYADPDAEGKQVKGSELMKRLNVDARELKKRKDLTVITEGQIIPGAASGTGQRSTGGVDGLVNLFEQLTGSDADEGDGEGEAAATAETDEESDSEPAEESAE